jgi:excisionase family DNA binding protein
LTTALPKSEDRPDDGNAALMRLCCMIVEDQARIKAILALLAAFVGFDAPPVDATERTTVKLAAGDLGCSPSRVRQWIEDGSLKAIKVGGKLLVDSDSVAKLVAARNSIGA